MNFYDSALDGRNPIIDSRAAAQSRTVNSSIGGTLIPNKLGGSIFFYGNQGYSTPVQYASAGGRTLPFVMPIMSAARALAATLAGRRTELAFPLMPVTIKTPALPVVIAAPAPGVTGQWVGREPGLWHFMGTEHRHHGFVLTGQHTARRGEQSRLVQI